MAAIKHYSALCVLVVVVLCSARPAAGEQDVDEILLKEKTTVIADKIRLGDVVKNAEELPGGLGSLPLGNAPWAGRVRKVGSSLIELRLVAAGYDRVPFEIAGSKVCLVRRQTKKISAEEITRVARRYLLEQLPTGKDNVSVEVLNDVHPVELVDSDTGYDLRASHRQSGSLVGRTRIKVGVVENGKRVDTAPVIFRVRVYRPVAVATRSMSVSSAISQDSITWKRRDLGGIRGDCVIQGENLSNKILNRSVSPGQVITHNMLKEKKQPVCVEPQQLVNLVVQTKTLRVVVRGKSLEQGRKGEWVKALNRKTGQKVSGQVIGDGQIRVEM